MAEEEVTVEPTLPGLELPEYHGRKPSGMKTSISGTGNRITTAHDIGAKVIFLVEAKVKKAGHEEGENGLVYTEGLSTVDLFELPGAQGIRLLSTVRSAYRTATEGAPPIPYDKGAEVKTDASGVVITPADAAGTNDADELVRALTDESLTPVVVIYSDGARELWPDEFDKGDPRPKIGAVVLDQDDVESVVVRILHGETGETLEEWTDEQEAARLLAAEHAAAQAEANETFAADVAVHEEIMAGRGESPDVQVDPPEANEDLDGDPEDTFPGYAGDGPDDELVIDDGPAAPESEVTFVEDEDGFADVVKFPGGEPVETPADREPTGEECLFVDREIKDLKPMIAELTDRDEVLGYLIAENAGRGRKLKPRKGVIDALTKRAAELFTDEGFAAPDLPADPEGFMPPEGADEFGGDE